MRTTLLLCFLAFCTVSTNASVVRAPATRGNMTIGVIHEGDKLLNRQLVCQEAINNTVQYQMVAYRGNDTTRITGVRAVEIGPTQFASAKLISGGVGQNNAIVRVQSARGYGYKYQVEIWGC